jgi:hypothetical protein
VNKDVGFRFKGHDGVKQSSLRDLGLEDFRRKAAGTGV